MTIDEIAATLKSAKWVSLSTEIRPSTVKAADGSIKPLYCSREFEFPETNLFTLKFKNFADPFGKVPLLMMALTGHLVFGAEHPVARGAFEIDYVADIAFSITLLNDQLAGTINGLPDQGLGKWSVGTAKDVFNQEVPAFGLKAGKAFKEYDLIYLNGNMLFNGARHIDGRPFDSPENRPTNLQIPLLKVALG